MLCISFQQLAVDVGWKDFGGEATTGCGAGDGNAKHETRNESGEKKVKSWNSGFSQFFDHRDALGDAPVTAAAIKR
jgi:hypothetical protein